MQLSEETEYIVEEESYYASSHFKSNDEDSDEEPVPQPAPAPHEEEKGLFKNMPEKFKYRVQGTEVVNVEGREEETEIYEGSNFEDSHSSVFFMENDANGSDASRVQSHGFQGKAGRQNTGEAERYYT